MTGNNSHTRSCCGNGYRFSLCSVNGVKDDLPLISCSGLKKNRISGLCSLDSIFDGIILLITDRNRTGRRMSLNLYFGLLFLC